MAQANLDMEDSADVGKDNGNNSKADVLTFDAPKMVGESQPMAKLKSMIQAIGSRDCTALIHGETGSGKELIARQLHAVSPRADKPFIAVDCTTLRDTLFESQLFGHEKGAFTGADRATLGFFRAADGGTLFLDEIGELDLPVQAKLLRVVQERAVTPLGSTKPVPINVRLICATHRELKEMVQANKFREDLFFRLNVVKLIAPPLRDRQDDIIALCEFFLEDLAAMYEEPVKKINADAANALQAYHWPGNVRELANAMEHAVALAPGRSLSVDDLPEHVREMTVTDAQGNTGDHIESDGLGESDPVIPLDEAEKMLVAKALRLSDGNQSRAARMLQVERRRLYRMVDRFGLSELVKGK